MDKFEYEGGEEMMPEEMADAEMAPAEDEAPKEAPTKILAVLSSQDDDFQPWDKIVTSKEFTDHGRSPAFTFKSTTYEKYLEGKMKDDFDAVLLVFMGAVSSDDLEMKQDYYDYYTKVPIVHFAFAKLKQDEEEMKGVTAYLRKTCEKQLLKADPILFNDLTNTQECVDILFSGSDELVDKRSQIFEQIVKPSYNKFDKDGNGTIDLNELGELSKELGQPLSEEQLATAMTDLDLNGDGVIDMDEFSRWYFTGMKAYNGNTRSMLQMRNQTSTIMDILAKDEIQQLIKEDKTLTKHQIKVQFNEPPPDHFIEVVGHLLGPFNEEMIGIKNEFLKELGSEVTPFVGKGVAHLYFQVEISMKPGGKAKYEEYCKKYNDLWVYQILDSGKKDSPEPHVKFYAEDDKVIVKFMMVFPQHLSPLSKFDIPAGLKEGLKDVDQQVKVKILTGVDGAEIIGSGKPLAEHALNGFSVQINIQFLKKIKKAIMSGMEGTQFASKIQEVLSMAGPGFSVGSNLNLQVNFKDMDEVKAHPMASQILITLDQIIQMACSTDQESMLAWTPDFSAIPKEDLDKHLEESKYAMTKQKMLDFIKLNQEFLKDVNPDTKASIKSSIFDIGGFEITVQGHCYGEIVSLIMQMATFKLRNEHVEAIVQDYKESKEPKPEEEKPDEEKPEEEKPEEAQL